MALDFPASPTNGQIFSSGGVSWSFDGDKWKVNAGTSVEPVFVSSTAPTGVAGQIYWDSDESTAYIYYDDGNTAQWVPLVSTAPVSFDTSAIISGTLPVARGGTGTTSFDSGKIAEGNTEAEVVDTGSDGHFKVTTEGTERVRIGPAGQIGLAGSNYGTDGQCLTSTGSATAPEWRTPPLSNRNLIINGAMNVAQRGTSAVTASGAFPVDRFKPSYNVTGGGFSAQQSTDVPEGFKNSVKFTVTTAASAGSSEVSSLFMALEGQDTQQADLGLSTSKPLTLSFYVKSSLTGTYSVSMRNSDGSRSYIAEYSISSADTWEKKTVTFPAITSGTWAIDSTTGLMLTWDLGSGSDRQGTAGQWLSGTNDFASTNNVNWCNTASATWFITGVQLEVGSVATPFEHRSYADELHKCMRYYQEYTSSTNGLGIAGAGYVETSTLTEFAFHLSTPMRTLASTRVQEIGDLEVKIGSNNYDVTGLNGVAFNDNFSLASVRVDNSNSGASVGTVARLRANGAGAGFSFDAEL